MRSFGLDPFSLGRILTVAAVAAKTDQRLRVLVPRPPTLLLPIPVPGLFYLTLHSVFSGLPLHASGPQIGTEINLATASQVRLKTLMGTGMEKGRQRGRERNRERPMQLLGRGQRQLVTRDLLQLRRLGANVAHEITRCTALLTLYSAYGVVLRGAT